MKRKKVQQKKNKKSNGITAFTNTLIERVSHVKFGKVPAVSALFRQFRTLSLRIVVLTLAVGMNGLALFDVQHTNAFYLDIETSTGNTFESALLDFELAGTPWIPTADAVDLDPGETASRTVTIVDTDSIAFKYIVESIQTEGDTAFCEALDLQAFLEGVLKYNGPLLGFLSATSTFGSTTDDWRFEVTLPVSETGFNEGETCAFDFVYSGWQERYDGLFEGYHDVETTENTLVAQNNQCVVIDFETDPRGANIYKGQPIDDEYSLWGVTISAENNSHDGKPDLAIAFDSANPTGGDYDLGTPNNDFGGGPGIGSGGEAGKPGENSEALDNVLIIAENDRDRKPTYRGDGYIDRPDDEGRGGTITFTFDEPTYVEGLTLVDIDGNEKSANVKLYGESGLLLSQNASAYGNNSVENILLDTDGVTSLEVFLKRSGAIDNLCVTPITKVEYPYVVLNEVLAQPDKNDLAPKNREFIEIYNNGSSSIDIAGWQISELTGTDNERFYPIVATNATSGEMQVVSSTTILSPQGHLGLQFGANQGKLNDGGDTVRLYDNNGVLRDTYKYKGSKEGKADARNPDGTGIWVDPEPTPGEPNEVTEDDLEEAGYDEAAIMEILDLEEEASDDTEAPLITLTGSSTVRVALGEVYTDLGATATDNIDQTLNVEIYDEDVYTDEVGTYEVLFVVFDEAGNMGSAIREVVVYDPLLEPEEAPATQESDELNSDDVVVREEEELIDPEEPVDGDDPEEDAEENKKVETGSGGGGGSSLQDEEDATEPEGTETVEESETEDVPEDEGEITGGETDDEAPEDNGDEDTEEETGEAPEESEGNGEDQKEKEVTEDEDKENVEEEDKQLDEAEDGNNEGKEEEGDVADDASDDVLEPASGEEEEDKPEVVEEEAEEKEEIKEEEPKEPEAGDTPANKDDA